MKQKSVKALVWQFLKLSTLLFLISTSIGCTSSKNKKEKMIQFSFIVELADSLDARYLEKKLDLPNNEKIKRINRSKNIFNFSLIISEENKSKMVEIMEADSNIISVVLEDGMLQNSEGKPVGVKKVKPIIKK